jgi:hypothetical protein
MTHTAQQATARLGLSLPWIPVLPASLDEITVERGVEDVLEYPDGIRLQVQLVDPAMYPDTDGLRAAVRSSEGPGRLPLVAGAVPVAWRAELRMNHISFLDVSGAAEILWPRVAVSAWRFTVTGQRRRSAVSLQQGHALVAQEILVATRAGARPTIGAIARGASVHLSTASRAIAQLAAQGMVARSRAGHRVSLSVPDPATLGERLAARTSWPGPHTIYAYLHGRNPWDIAARLSGRAGRADMALTVTGRVGAGFLGVTRPPTPPQVRCWVATSKRDLVQVVRALGLEPASPDDANIAISADRWGVGVHRASPRTLDASTATVAHPLRIWCDLHAEQRGDELAAQLWGRIVLGSTEFRPTPEDQQARSHVREAHPER